MILVLRQQLEPVVRIVQVNVPVIQSAPSAALQAPLAYAPNLPAYVPATPLPVAAMSYWRMEQQALSFGVEGLPSTTSDGSETSPGPAGAGADLSVGSSPKLNDHPALFHFGEP